MANILDIFLKPCQKCGRQKLWFLVKKRQYRSPVGEILTSKAEYCVKCHTGLTTLFANMKVGK